MRLGNPVVPRFLAAAVGVGSAAVLNAYDSLRSSAFDDQSDLYADLSNPGSIIATAIEPPALTRKSCAPYAAAWANDACVLTSTFVKAAAGQYTWSPFSIDNLLRHSLNADAMGAIIAIGNGFGQPMPSAQYSQTWHRLLSGPPAETIASDRY